MISPELFATYGLLGIFIWSILESSILPVPAELVVIPLSPYYDPLLIAIIGGSGSVIGCSFDYYIGLKNIQLIKNSKLFGKERIKRGMDRLKEYEKYGELGIYGSLFIARVIPTSLKPIMVIAGLFKVNVFAFLLIIFIGSFIRYLVAAVIGKTLLSVFLGG